MQAHHPLTQARSHYICPPDKDRNICTHTHTHICQIVVVTALEQRVKLDPLAPLHPTCALVPFSTLCTWSGVGCLLLYFYHCSHCHQSQHHHRRHGCRQCVALLAIIIRTTGTTTRRGGVVAHNILVFEGLGFFFFPWGLVFFVSGFGV